MGCWCSSYAKHAHVSNGLVIARPMQPPAPWVLPLPLQPRSRRATVRALVCPLGSQALLARQSNMQIDPYPSRSTRLD